VTNCYKRTWCTAIFFSWSDSYWVRKSWKRMMSGNRRMYSTLTEWYGTARPRCSSQDPSLFTFLWADRCSYNVSFSVVKLNLCRTDKLLLGLGYLTCAIWKDLSVVHFNDDAALTDAKFFRKKSQYFKQITTVVSMIN